MPSLPDDLRHNELPLGLTTCAAALALLASACTTTPAPFIDQGQITYGSTAVAVDPSTFLGGVPCGFPGGMRSYVATVIDQGDPTDANARPFVLPSSPPTPCSQSTYFSLVNVGHTYIATVDGYEQSVDEFDPSVHYFDGDASVSPSRMGNPTMALLSTGADINPRWTNAPAPSGDAGTQRPARCDGALVTPSADDPVGIAAIDTFTVTLGSRGPLYDCGTAQRPTIQVKPLATLGNLACVATGGTVQAFDILPSDPTLAPVTNVDCSSSATTTFATGVKANTTYTFVVAAHEASDGGTNAATLTAQCTAKAKAGITVVAICDPLLPKTP